MALEEGVEGLIHVSEMSWTKKVKNPRSILEIGQEVEVVVSEVDTEKRRLSLSLRATEPNPWEQVAETYQRREHHQRCGSEPDGFRCFCGNRAGR